MQPNEGLIRNDGDTKKDVAANGGNGFAGARTALKQNKQGVGTRKTDNSKLRVLSEGGKIFKETEDPRGGPINRKRKAGRGRGVQVPS